MRRTIFLGRAKGNPADFTSKNQKLFSKRGPRNVCFQEGENIVMEGMRGWGPFALCFLFKKGEQISHFETLDCKADKSQKFSFM
ncbi:MAG: hypothetical protein D6797_04590 [Bdellovibrio sp.]|nr:MAG: hypothetical protein D6797_04590 [Bdellovibrio sp.]